MLDLSEIYSIKQMNQFIQAVTSRTVWTIIVMVLVNGVPAVTGLIPAGLVPLVNVVLGLLATYFKVSPSQAYGKK
jgi:hypothetical protein